MTTKPRYSEELAEFKRIYINYNKFGLKGFMTHFIYYRGGWEAYLSVVGIRYFISLLKDIGYDKGNISRTKAYLKYKYPDYYF